MDLTFQVPMQYCFYNIELCFYHQSHPQLGIAVALAPSLHSFCDRLTPAYSLIHGWKYSKAGLDSVSAPSPLSGVGPLIFAFPWIFVSCFSFSRHMALSETLLVEPVSTGKHHWLNAYEFEEAPGDGERGKPVVLQSMGSQRAGHDWAMKQQQQNWR